MKIRIIILKDISFKTFNIVNLQINIKFANLF